MFASTARTHPSDPVSRIMVWPVATIYSQATLREVAESLAADGIGALGVLDHNILVGMVSERDVVNHLAQRANPEHVTAGEVMTTDLVSARPDASILEVAQQMLDAEVRHVPVLDNGAIAGFVSMRDIVAVLAGSAAL